MLVYNSWKLQKAFGFPGAFKGCKMKTLAKNELCRGVILVFKLHVSGDPIDFNEYGGNKPKFAISNYLVS